MIGYTTIGVSDVDAAKKFYLDLFADQGAEVKIDAGRIVFLGIGKGNAMLAICDPYDKQAPTPGNGVMLAFPVSEKSEADRLHARALELGATNDGDPGQRVPDRFYGAYALDPDGNKLCFYMFG
jgi:catechol 2,3-dioxygenase-like lactoylglutathione lyase family enzyme